MVLSIFQSGGTAGKVPAERLQQPEVRRAFRHLRLWALAYLAASGLALVAAFVVPHGGSVGSAIGVWIRCGVVTLIAGIIYVLAIRAQGGRQRAFRVLRVFVWLESIGFILVALIVPGYPLWLRIVTAVIGLLALGTALASGSRHLRGVLASRNIQEVAGGPAAR